MITHWRSEQAAASSSGGGVGSSHVTGRTVRIARFSHPDLALGPQLVYARDKLVVHLRLGACHMRKVLAWMKVCVRVLKEVLGFGRKRNS